MLREAAARALLAWICYRRASSNPASAAPMTTLFDSTSAAEVAVRALPSARGRPSFEGSHDEVWRPGSWDIREVANFALALSADLGTDVSRITLNPASWSQHPRLLPLPGRYLRIDWSAVDEVSVRRGYEPRLTIRLAPPLPAVTRVASPQMVTKEPMFTQALYPRIVTEARDGG